MIIPKGIAHGFKSLEDNTIVTYLQTSCYASDNDDGIRYDSFGFNWGPDHIEMSERDRSFKAFKEYKSPFLYGNNS